MRSGRRPQARDRQFEQRAEIRRRWAEHSRWRPATGGLPPLQWQITPTAILRVVRIALRDVGPLNSRERIAPASKVRPTARRLMHPPARFARAWLARGYRRREWCDRESLQRSGGVVGDHRIRSADPVAEQPGGSRETASRCKTRCARRVCGRHGQTQAVQRDQPSE